MTAPFVAPRSGRRTVGLRRRILLIFTLGSMTLSAFLAVTTFGLTRTNVVQQRDRASVEATRRNAQIVQSSLRANPPNIEDARDALAGFGVQRAIIWYRPSQEWYPARDTPARYEPSVLPTALVDRVLDDAVPARMIIDVAGESTIAVGWPIPNTGAYFEFFGLEEVNNTLGSVRLSLVFAGIITTGLGVLLGVFAARRAVRPLGAAAPGGPGPPRRPDRSRTVASTPGSSRPTIPISACSRTRSTRWPPRSNSVSSATPGSRPMSATSSDHR